jgi:murein DD-endopeptidase MepM/ murein hydrolase activator NlpD
LLLAAVVPCAVAQPFHLPTANRALFDKDGGGDRFFTGTSSRPWPSGTFGCVRSDGGQIHEGLDIRCLKRDKRGEPVDPVMASCDGTVAYINKRSGLSNYGNYIVLRHVIEGTELYTLYAHLSVVADGLRAGQAVKAGDVIATMGRTSNTRERISQDRAHVHFEINLFLSDRFPAWYKKNHPKDKDDHGIWNGINLAGLDPQLLLHEQRARGAKFSVVDFIRRRPELCRVLVRDTSFSFLKRYPMLVQEGRAESKEPVAGYEISLDYNGVPFRLTPRTAAEIKGKARIQLVSVNAEEQAKNPCRRLVTRRGTGWELSARGAELFELLVD